MAVFSITNWAVEWFDRHCATTVEVAAGFFADLLVDGSRESPVKGRSMAAMTDDERDAFLLEVRLGNIAVGRVGKGPLLAPIWYSLHRRRHRRHVHGCHLGQGPPDPRRRPGDGWVVDPGSNGVYRYVAVEGPMVTSSSS